MIKKLIRFFNPQWVLMREKLSRDSSGRYAEINEKGYSVRIINRGEQLIYSDGNGSLIVEISIYGKWLDVGSIRKWDEIVDVSVE